MRIRRTALILLLLGSISFCSVSKKLIKPIDSCALLIPKNLWFIDYPLLGKPPEKATKKELVEYILSFQKVSLDNTTNTIEHIAIMRKSIECYQKLLKDELE